MGQPPTYTRQYNFNDFATTSPSTPLPGDKVDAELNAAKLTLDELNANIAKIQRDDGKLGNTAVHKDAFDAGALALISAGSMTPQGSWSSGRSYVVNDLVDFNGATYLATVAHSSLSAFATDLAASRWILLANAAISGTANSVDKFSGTGSQTAFTLSTSYQSNTSVLVFVNGALRNPGDDYSISGTTLTFVTAPPVPSVSGNENVIAWGPSVVAQAAYNLMASSSANASGFADEAESWASKVNGIVESTDYSSKAYAIGGTGVDAGSGSAKDWATKTGGAVGNTSEYSAKYWATQANVGTVAGAIASINTVAGISSDVTAVAGVSTSVAALSTPSVLQNMSYLGGSENIFNMSTLATHTGSISTVANIANNVSTVAGVASDVTTVAGVSSAVSSVAAFSGSDLSTVAGVASDVTTVAANAADLQTVANEIDNNKLQTVATNIAAVVTAADDLNEATSEIDTVATNITNVNNVGGSISNVNTVAGLTGTMTSILALESNINTLGAIGSDIQTVSGIANGVTTCAIQSQQIANVSNNSTNVNLVGNAIYNVNQVGSNIATVNTVASNLTNVNAFHETYRIGTSDPTSSNDEGDLFFNQTTKKLRYYNNTAWVDSTAIDAYVHPNHSGEVTSSADGATVIADNIVDEANLKVSNSPTNGYFLSAQSGNTGGLTWAEAGGGASASADLYIANPSSATSPTASGTNAVAIGDNAVASGFATISIGKDSDATGTNSIALGRWSQSTGHGGSIAIGLYADSSGDGSVAIGSRDENNTAIATGDTSVALGTARATGADSLAGVITNNTNSYGATGASSVAMGPNAIASGYGSLSLGKQNTASASYSTVVGSYVSTASANYSGVFGGRTNTASSTYATVVGGTTNVASGQYSAVIGGQGNTASGEYGVAMGESSTASHTNSVSIGNNVQSTAHSQINLGGTGDTVRISETYTLPTADGNANQVLQTNGSGALSFATVSGGGSAPNLFVENYSSGTLPTAAGTGSVSIGISSSASGADSFAVGRNAIASGNYSYAGGGFCTSSGVGSAALAGSYIASSAVTASGNYSTAIGLNSGAHGAVASGTGSVAIGGSKAGGTSSFAAAVTNNSATYGATSTNSIAIGPYAKAAAYAVSIGEGNVCNAVGSISMGSGNTLNGIYSTAIGSGCQTGNNHTYTFVIGRKGATRGPYSFTQGIYGASGTSGEAQTAQHVLFAGTTNATPDNLALGGDASFDYIVLPNNGAYAFDGTIVTRQQAADGTISAAWQVKGLIRREANAGSTVLVNSAIEVLSNASSLGLALSADTTNGGLAITCTGLASTDLRWVGTIQTTEIVYA